MVDEWQMVPISEIAASSGMGPFGSSIKVETFVPEGVPIISGQHLHGAFLDESPGFNFITPTHAARHPKSICRAGDIIFTHAGTIGQVALIPSDSFYKTYILSQRQYYLRVNHSVADPAFVMRFFKTPEGRHQLLANATQVGVPSISRPLTNLRTIRLPLPPLPEQRAIAHVLGAIDDKIDLNRRMAGTLEEMARALFTSWFVRFDPVRAKMAGQPTGLPAHIEALFPDALVDSELGEVPEGWGVGALSDLATAPRSSVDPRGLPPETQYLGLEHLPRRSWAIAERGTTADVESSKSVVSRGDILFGKIRPYFHKVGPSPIDGVCSADILVFKPIEVADYAYVLCLVSSDAFVSYATQVSNGAKMPRVTTTDALRYLLAVPPATIRSAFQMTVLPLVSSLLAACDQSETLTALRDTLLPKLVSGEVRITDPEAFLRRAGLDTAA